MGIDITVEWPGQTEEEKAAQVTGFSVWDGHVGYLREAYHGGPYATMILVAEAFDAKHGTAQIPAATLRARLPEAIAASKERNDKIYHDTGEELEKTLKSFTDFVELCERKEAETGQPCTIHASY